jgi:MYXO-CTERM domain-containing protein
VLEAATTGGYRPPFWAYSGSSELDPTLTQVGDPCTDTSECTAGTVCYFESDPSDAVCTPVCANSRQCKSGQECRAGFDVEGGGLCFDVPGGSEPQASSDAEPPEPRAGEDKCSTTPGTTGSSTSAWLLAALGMASWMRARSRRPAR